MLKGRLGYLGDREKVLSENIANASTPNYAPKDMKPFAFKAAMDEQASGGLTGGVQMAGVQAAGGGGMAITQPQHLALSRKSVTHGKVAKGQNDSEVTLDGNAVVLEEQMIKLTESRMDYEAAIGFYQKSLGLLRMAAKAPGK
jgi:flagellar basal-body rod protein FlgB